MYRLLMFVVAYGLVVGGVATWTIGGALLTAGVLLGAAAVWVDVHVVDDGESGT